MTLEQIQAVKETGVCCEKELRWYPEDEGVTTVVDGEKQYELKKWTRGDCLGCGTIYRKTREEVVEKVVEPTIINLDAVE